MEDRLEDLEDTVAGLTSRLKRWSDPSEIAEEVSGLEEEISVALGRFHKRLESVAETVEANLHSVLQAEIGNFAEEVGGMRAAFEQMTVELQRVPALLASHRAALAEELKRPVKSARRRARRADRDDIDEGEATGPGGTARRSTAGTDPARGDGVVVRGRPSRT